MEFMRSQPDNAFDLAVVDPPYGVLNLGGRAATSAVRSSRRINPGKLGRLSSAWDVPPGPEYFDELFRVSANQIIWGGNYFALPPTRGFAVWDKRQPWPNLSGCEFAWTSFNTPAKIFAYDTRRERGKIHPTQKPVALYRWILEKYANRGDRLFDSHMGSGASRIAAHELGFDFTGCEIDRDYFEAAESRFNGETAQGVLC